MSKRPKHRLSAALKRKILGKGNAPAQSPGSLIHIGDRRAEDLLLSAVVFDADSIDFREIKNIGECPPQATPGKVTWVHISGLHETEQIAKLGKIYDIHPLHLEDILNTHSRPKIEDFDDRVFIINKMLTYTDHDHSIDVQHSALLLLPGNILLTFLEGPSEVFAPVYNRLQTGGAGRIRTHGADYLAWALIDAVVDNYFHVADGVMDTLSLMEDTLQENPHSVDAHDLFNLKKEVSALHRMVRPVRDMATVLHGSDCSVLSEEIRPYLRDLYDHAHQVRESVDELRDSASSLRDFYLTIASNKMNEVMKVLTCFSTIFLPLTFLAGIYGMNFKVLPELDWPYGYPILWGLFLIIAAVMFYFFRRKNWL